MQALKGLVIGLGILIIVGFLLLIYGFYAKMTDPEFRIIKAEATSDAVSAPTANATRGAGKQFGEVRLALPVECTVVDMRADGGRLYLRTGPEGVCERIVIVDAIDGRVLGTLVLGP